jgi:hypothetical protein
MLPGTENSWSVCGQTAQQRCDAVIDQLAHDERRAGALDSRDGQDLTGDAVKVVGVGRHDVHEQVDLAADAVYLQYFRDGAEGPADVVELALGYPGW